tara:strand:+ start:149 stop:913 length:765 start_codon:yes stop_codon:yes gene_type:complete
MKSKSNQLRKSEEKLQKYLANSGFTTRRNIKNFLAQNTVTKSNKKLKAESLVYDNDCLTISGEDHIVDLNPELEILIYHKDVGQICSNTATDNKETVFSKIPPRKKGKWIMVGRLDINTSGLLLFTNNGDFSNKLSHPSSNIDREYLCRVYGEVTDSKLSKLLKGIKIQNETSNFSDIVAVKKQGKSKNQWFYVCLFTGKNREVRKLWKSQGLIVNRLIRVRYGSILLPENLKASGWKKLSTKEIKKLKNTYKI